MRNIRRRVYADIEMPGDLIDEDENEKYIEVLVKGDIPIIH